MEECNGRIEALEILMRANHPLRIVDNRIAGAHGVTASGPCVRTETERRPGVHTDLR